MRRPGPRSDAPPRAVHTRVSERFGTLSGHHRLLCAAQARSRLEQPLHILSPAARHLIERPGGLIGLSQRPDGVAAPQISTLVRRLAHEGAIERADGRFVLIGSAASEATPDEVAVIEGDAGSPEEDV